MTKQPDSCRRRKARRRSAMSEGIFADPFAGLLGHQSIEDRAIGRPDDESLHALAGGEFLGRLEQDQDGTVGLNLSLDVQIEFLTLVEVRFLARRVGLL